MANDLNRWQGIGRLGTDPTSRYTKDGGAVVSFSIACGQSWKDKNSGEKKEKTEWVNITAFGKLGEICAQYLKKGSQVYIEGRLQTDKFTDKETGKERYSTKVVAETMQMLGGRTDAKQEKEPQTESAASAGGEFDDDIPFAQHERGFVA